MPLAVSLLVVVLLLAANAFFVAAEFALVKARGLRIESLAAEGGTRAGLTLTMLKEIESYLASCQLGITMASLGLGWVGEPAVAALIEPVLRPLGISAQTLHLIAFVLGFLIFSSLHIVVGEQVPKTFAIRKPEPIALWCAVPLVVFYRLTYPLTWALSATTRAILGRFGVAEASHVEVYSGDELRGLIDVSAEKGALRKLTREMLGGILDLDDVEVRQIMVHRRDMHSVDVEAPLPEILRQIREGPYTRYPVWRGEPDQIVGILRAKDLISAVLEAGGTGEGVDVAKLCSTPWYVPNTTSLRQQLLAFRQRRAHLALVVDEYGVLQGLVTLEDVIEEIVGDIQDETDAEMPGIDPQADGSVLVEGRIPVRDLNRRFGWSLPEEDAATIAGLVIETARRIPEPGEAFELEGFRIHVMRRQRHQLTQLRLEPAIAPESGASESSAA